ncbi:hypothetical protein CEXT_551141 [Caerostris extrusa]|uniref:Uncharacterized protein n=1 Tax=Caerostris extrusa TaxID=172846 RepID=A0AAV4RQ74_CAEEX|nr:hypothetical protein CEXT_551141 [Caerostris extrusa]
MKKPKNPNPESSGGGRVLDTGGVSYSHYHEWILERILEKDPKLIGVKRQRTIVTDRVRWKKLGETTLAWNSTAALKKKNTIQWSAWGLMA